MTDHEDDEKLDQIQSQIEDLEKEKESRKSKKSKKASEEEEDEKYQAGVKAGLRRASKALLNAASDEDEKQKMHDRVAQSDDEEMKEAMDKEHEKTPTLEEGAKRSKKASLEAKIHDLQGRLADNEARLARYESKEKEVILDDLVTLKANYVSNIDEEMYRTSLEKIPFKELEATHRERLDEIEAMKAREKHNENPELYAFNTSGSGLAASVSGGGRKMGSLGKIFNGGLDE